MLNARNYILLRLLGLSTVFLGGCGIQTKVLMDMPPSWKLERASGECQEFNGIFSVEGFAPKSEKAKNIVLGPAGNNKSISITIVLNISKLIGLRSESQFHLYPPDPLGKDGKFIFYSDQTHGPALLYFRDSFSSWSCIDGAIHLRPKLDRVGSDGVTTQELYRKHTLFMGEYGDLIVKTEYKYWARQYLFFSEIHEEIGWLRFKRVIPTGHI